MDFSTDGAELHAKPLSEEDLTLLTALADGTFSNRPGTRLTGDKNLSCLLAKGSALDCIAKSELGEEAKRAFDAMMQMKKIDIAAINAARKGESEPA